MNPVLHKEFRVLSRRKRTYAVRTVSVLLFALIFWANWDSLLRDTRLAQFAGVHWMSMATRFTTARVMHLVFLVTPVLAVVLLSGSLSEEILFRRLDVMRSVGLSHGKIVRGKLFSRLLQLLLILVLCLPVLAIIRIWGGIDDRYLLHSLGITAVTSFFAAALTAWLSAYCHRPCRVILIALVVLIALYSLQIIMYFVEEARAVLLVTNPYVVMDTLNANLLQPGPATPKPGSWPLFYGVMGGGGVLFLGLAVLGLKGQEPQEQRYGNWFQASWTPRRPGGRRGARLVAWLDGWNFHSVWLNHLMYLLLLVIPVGAVLGTGIYTQWQGGGILKIRTVFIMALYLVVLLRTVTTAAHVIGREKDAGSWTGLLTTPLSNGQILRGKAWAVVVTNAMGWLVLCAGLVAYTWAMSQVGRFMDPSMTRWQVALAIAQMLGYGFFALGAGLFWAVHLRTSLQALIAAMASLVAGYALYQYGVQPWFARTLLPKLMAGGNQAALMKGVYTFSFCVTGLQCLAGLCLGFFAQLRLRRGNVT